ncbi:protein translocase subunit SecF, partial [Patescibacteria group bacterium]|nr:protein translocase subunit SecF [Patescibacteria group bacterium]
FPMLNIIGRRKLWYIISAVIIIPGLISLITNGLLLGIDFKGGTLMELEFVDQENVNTENIRQNLAPLELGNLIVQSSGPNKIIIRTDTLAVEDDQTTTPAPNEIDQSSPSEIGYLISAAHAQETENDQTDVHESDQSSTAVIIGGTEKYHEIISILQDKYGTIDEIRYEAIGPTVSKDLATKTIWAIIIASLCIILYLAWAFRNVPAPASPWRFGICAVAALLHDVIFVLGIYSILGAVWHIELDILFLPAILTVMSFSVHDSIVVFDRVRENLRKYTKNSFEEVVNISVNETLVRSLNLSLTVVVTLAALYLFGGESIKIFVLTLIIGIISGTYSSIFNASPLLVTWHYMTNKKD